MPVKKYFLFVLFAILFSPAAVLAQDSNPSSAPAGAASASADLSQKMVKSVEVKGNKTISLATILSKIKTRVGERYLQTVISDDLKRLYNTGYFSDVSVDREEYEGGFKVIFLVTEKAIIERISFSKLSYFNARGLERKLKSKKGKFFDQKSLQDDIRMIKDSYEQKGLTQVEVDVKKATDDLTNKVDLHFIIKEGTRVKIKRILVEGNQTFSDKKILRLIKTRPDTLFTSGYLKEETLKEDMERIHSFYERQGFIDVKAEYKLEQLKGAHLNVAIMIGEGKQYFVEKITVEGNKVIDKEKILETMTEVKPSGVFSRERLTVDLSNIRTLYFDKGYIFANVRESTSMNPDTGKVAIKLEVLEGDLAFINRIRIQGNDRTRDIVIRRELKLFPGDQFDGEKLRRSKQTLTNLGYFEEIAYDVEDTNVPNRKDLVVQVKEAKTGSLSFGGGFSTVDQLVGFVEIEQKNFDFTNWPTFTGGGQNLSVRAETGSTRSNTRLSFTEPWLFDYPISAGFDAYRSEHSREQNVGYGYDETRTGGGLRLGKRFGEYISTGVNYNLEKIDIGNFDTNASADLLAEEGKNTLSSVGLFIARDTRDSPFSPTRGLFSRLGFDLAGGPLSGDKDFYRVTTRNSYDIPLKLGSVLEFRLQTGIVNAYGDSEKVPIFERFFAGGARTIRGYNERKVGPLDAVTEDPLGGEAMLVGNIEYTVPIMDFLKAAAFYDIGSVWQEIGDFASGNFKSGIGGGLRVKTPVGPINLDYGIPLNDEPGEDRRSGKFYFSVSRGF